MLEITDKIKERLREIRLLITDIDGVWTDGGLYYTEEGLIMKKFNVKDGMAIRILRQAGIETAIITTDVSKPILARAETLGIENIYTGVWNKEVSMDELCDKKGLKRCNVAFIGDDINDLSIFAAAGFTACPSDAVDSVKKVADIILANKGGDAVFREYAELIISAQTNGE